MPDYPDLPWPQIHEYLMEIATARNIDQLLHQALTKIGGLIPFDHTGILGFINIPKKVIFQETIGGSAACTRAFQEYYYQVMPDVGINKAKFGATDWNDFSGTEYVTDFIRPNNIRYSAGISNFGQNGLGDLSISINRSNDLPAFSELELNILEVVQGHLANYLAMLSLANPNRPCPEAADVRVAFPSLTRRESEIAALLCRKYSAEMIGSQLLVSPLTVYKHIENIYGKMNVNNRKKLRAKLLGSDEEIEEEQCQMLVIS